MSKTIREWFEEYPDKELGALMIEHAEEYGSHLSVTHSLSASLMTAFPWCDTSEGEDYWERIYNTASAAERKQ